MVQCLFLFLFVKSLLLGFLKISHKGDILDSNKKAVTGINKENNDVSHAAIDLDFLLSKRRMEKGLPAAGIGIETPNYQRNNPYDEEEKEEFCVNTFMRKDFS